MWLCVTKYFLYTNKLSSNNALDLDTYLALQKRNMCKEKSISTKANQNYLQVELSVWRSSNNSTYNNKDLFKINPLFTIVIM